MEYHFKILLFLIYYIKKTVINIITDLEASSNMYKLNKFLILTHDYGVLKPSNAIINLVQFNIIKDKFSHKSIIDHSFQLYIFSKLKKKCVL